MEEEPGGGVAASRDRGTRPQERRYVSRIACWSGVNGEAIPVVSIYKEQKEQLPDPAATLPTAKNLLSRANIW